MEYCIIRLANFCQCYRFQIFDDMNIINLSGFLKKLSNSVLQLQIFDEILKNKPITPDLGLNDEFSANVITRTRRLMFN